MKWVILASIFIIPVFEDMHEPTITAAVHIKATKHKIIFKGTQSERDSRIRISDTES